MKACFRLFLILTFSGVVACSNPNSDNSNTNTRCAQCGMPTEEFQAWRSKIISSNAVKHFCSPRCLFINSQAQGLAATDSVLVTDYYEQQWIDGRQAFYIIGSDVIGPMGHDLVPVATPQAAEEFMQEHQGKRILTFQQVNETVIKHLSIHSQH
ncbi:MAG: nitrous oxide reductase accessory protein NosL [Cytophagales bacterium]|nr:nitrous oxide reductase accessory protein NosL [Bernardetiaceae bacterium]MDW8204558.1 nitrous oxide reductase accessory protein NosL [Cytophagales bacterium]